MSYPPREPPPGWGWPHPPPYPQGWPPGSPHGNNHDPDLRERVAILETEHRHLVLAVHSHHDRLMAGDQRFGRVETSMADLDREGRAAIAEFRQGKSSKTSKRSGFAAIWRPVKDVLQWIVVLVGMIGILTGKFTPADVAGFLKGGAG